MTFTIKEVCYIFKLLKLSAYIDSETIYLKENEKVIIMPYILAFKSQNNTLMAYKKSIKEIIRF